MKIAEMFTGKTVFSLAVFTPKPNADESVIYNTLEHLTDIHPDFISVTYGAGVDGIHLYTMNNPYVAHKIYDAVQSLI